MIVRSFGVRARNKHLVGDLADDLDKELQSLQRSGWKIISVTATPVKEYGNQSYFESTLFTIVASIE